MTGGKTILNSMKNKAKLGLSVEPESKFNEFRARWIHGILFNEQRGNRGNGGHLNVEYFRAEYKAIPQRFKDEIEKYDALLRARGLSGAY